MSKIREHNDSPNESHAPKRGIGRPSHQPTPELFAKASALASAGLPDTSIANLVGLDVKTLRKHYGATIDNAVPALLMKSTSNIIKALNSRDEGRALQSAMYVLNRKGKQFGWTEQYLSEPFERLLLSKLTDQEFDELLRLVAKAGAKLTPIQNRGISGIRRDGG